MWPKGGVWWKAEGCQGSPPGRPTPLTAPETKPPGNSAPAVGRSRFAAMNMSLSSVAHVHWLHSPFWHSPLVIVHGGEIC